MDTGRAGTIFGQAKEDLLGLSYFRSNSWMPKPSYRLEALHTFPAAPDFTNVDGAGAGAFSYSKSMTKFTATAAGTGRRGNIGWNFGANKTKALFIVAIPQSSNRTIMLLNDGQPNTTEAAGANAIGFRIDSSIQVPQTGRISSANGWNNIAGWTAITSADGRYSLFGSRVTMCALYLDTAGAGVVKGFIREQAEGWTEVCSGASNHISVIRCATLLFSSSNVQNEMFAATPFGIYAE